MNISHATLGTLGALLTVAALTGCQGPNHGTVHDKQYSPAHTVVGTSCSTVGKTTVCHPTSQYYGDSWELDVYATNDDHGWRTVTSRAYDSCAIGDYFDGRSCR